MLRQLQILGKLDVNCRNEQGLTPIMVAVDKGHENLVRALATWGADVNAKDNAGESVIDHAITTGNKKLITALRILGAK